MEVPFIPDNPYLLLTPGPLSTSKGVRAAMNRDWCTWDNDYNNLVQEIRHHLTELAVNKDVTRKYTTVLMQGSGTFSMESVIGSVIPENGKLLVLSNGAYGKRIAQIADILNINYTELTSSEILPPNREQIDYVLKTDSDITHIAFVHCETTTGMLNPIQEICALSKQYGKTTIADCMSSFGGIPVNMDALGIDFLISSANKCIQGVPGFGFIVARKTELAKSENIRRSLSLSLFDQWKTMEDEKGKWRFTSPTHTVRAFHQALTELSDEGGIIKRFERYKQNQQLLAEGMNALGFLALLPKTLQSPIITTFLSPNSPDFNFNRFYNLLKEKGFVIYPGKVTDFNCFRIGNIGEVYPADIEQLLKAVSESMYWSSSRKVNH